MRIEHQKVQPLLAVFVMDSGDEHTLRRNPHHGSGREIRDGNARFADELFRFVVFVDTGKNDSVSAMGKELGTYFMFLFFRF